MAFSLNGQNGSVTLNGQTITVTVEPDQAVEKTTTVSAETVKGAAVWTGRLGGQFSLHYGADSYGGPDEFLSVRFGAVDKQWWDALASAIMSVVRNIERAKKNPRVVADTVVEDAIPPAPSSFDGWLNRTVG